MNLEREPTPHRVIKPTPEDFKIVGQHGQTLADIFVSLEDSIQYSINQSRKIREKIAFVITIKGATGRGKNVSQNLIHDYLYYSIANRTQRLPTVNRWENNEDEAFYRGELSVQDLFTPFPNSDLIKVTSDYEYEFFDNIANGEFVLGVMPYGGNLKLKDDNNGRVIYDTQGRAFASNTIQDFSHSRGRFSKLKPERVIYAASIGIGAHPFISRVMTGFRASLQNAANLEEANSICEDFMQEKFVDSHEWDNAREGGSIAQLIATENIIKNNAVDLVDSHHARLLVPSWARRVIEADSRGQWQDFASFAPNELIAEAVETAKFFDEFPSDKLVSNIILTFAVTEFEILFHKINLEMDEFDQPKVITPVENVILYNKPNINLYLSHQARIRSRLATFTQYYS